MKRLLVVTALYAIALAGLAAFTVGGSHKSSDWSMTATAIEACSCPMFCQCYFNTKPAGHVIESHATHGNGTEHFCKFNSGWTVERGHYGDVSLAGTKFWLTGDLGSDYSTGEMDWVILTFDKTMTPKQRQGLQTIIGHLFPAKWNSFSTAEGDISWKAGKHTAHALIDHGKTAEVKLTSVSGADSSDKPVVIKNLKYWGAASNDGFVLMPNEVEAYRVGDNSFEYKNSNGFMITVHIDSKSVQSASAGGSR